MRHNTGAVPNSSPVKLRAGLLQRSEPASSQTKNAQVQVQDTHANMCSAFVGAQTQGSSSACKLSHQD